MYGDKPAAIGGYLQSGERFAQITGQTAACWRATPLDGGNEFIVKKTSLKVVGRSETWSVVDDLAAAEAGVAAVQAEREAAHRARQERLEARRVAGRALLELPYAQRELVDAEMGLYKLTFVAPRYALQHEQGARVVLLFSSHPSHDYGEEGVVMTCAAISRGERGLHTTSFNDEYGPSEYEALVDAISAWFC